MGKTEKPDGVRRETGAIADRMFERSCKAHAEWIRADTELHRPGTEPPTPEKRPSDA